LYLRGPGGGGGRIGHGLPFAEIGKVE